MRREVREMKHLENEVAELRAQLQRNTVNNSTDVDVGAKDDFPPLPNTDINPTVIVRSESSGDTKSAVSFAQQANELKYSGMSDGARRQKYGKTVIGTLVDNQRIASVKTYRNVNIFVSRLHPCTVKEELVDCVSTVNDDIYVDNITRTKLKSRYEHLYSSFWVSVRVGACDMKNAIDVFLSPDAWPSGVLVKRYFVPKND